MSIGVTTVILFAVFALLLFASCPISVSIQDFFRRCGNLSVLGSDYLYYHAENEQRRREFFPACHPAVYPGWKYYE